MNTGISLGRNCEPAVYGVKNRIRNTIANGYKTCPFDLCVTNLKGVVECLKDDFMYFCDPAHLAVVEYSSEDLNVKNAVLGEELIKNTYYNFLFNHESPGHVCLYMKEKWSDGKYHFVDKNFNLFIQRYKNRINNFRNYLGIPDNRITFILKKESDETLDELNVVLSEKYPNLSYKILVLE